MKKSVIITVLSIVILIGIRIDCHAAETPYLDRELYPIVQQICEPYNICPELICAMIWTESRYDPSAKNGDCIGLMQINPIFQIERMKKLGITDLSDAESNIRVGVDFISELRQNYGELYYVLMIYNMRHDTAVYLYDTGRYSDYAVSITEISAMFERQIEFEQNNEVRKGWVTYASNEHIRMVNEADKHSRNAKTKRTV